MGQKVNPVGLRLGINKEWQSNYFASFRKNELANKVVEDELIRRYIKKQLKDASISAIEIFRNAEKTTVVINTSKPGMVIGKKGALLEDLRKAIENKITSKYTKTGINIKIKEVKNRFLDAELVGQDIAKQIESRGNYKRAIKNTMALVMQAGGKGIKIKVSGRLGGAEMARSEIYQKGEVPLSTLKADIDFAIVEAKTIMGIIGLKIWINRGEKIFN
ncbi:MAG: 30S ribosomal protein S3 [Spirochaetes bacterium]|nr:30S ribosomal protein S3 [Spirochaetota bacterium]